MFIPRELVRTMKFRNSCYSDTETYQWGYCTDITLEDYYSYAQPSGYTQTETGVSTTSDSSTTGWLTVDMSLIPSSAKYICIKRTTNAVWTSIQVVCNY